MKKTICVQEANEVDIAFNDRTYTATFNMKSVLYMQQELSRHGLEDLPYEHFAALVLYSGIKVNTPDFTIDEATALALTIRPFDLQGIVEEYVQSMDGVSMIEKDEQAKKVLAQILEGAVGTQRD